MTLPVRPAFATARLRAEPVESRHAPIMARVLDDPRVFRFLSDGPPTLAYLERQYAFLEGGKSPDGAEHWLTWILVPHLSHGAADEPIGYVQATIREPETAHVAYLLRPSHWRQGYGREALLALLRVVFGRFDVQRAVAEMDTRNEASSALVRSLGFHHVRTVHDAASIRGETSHEHVFELPRSAQSGR